MIPLGILGSARPGGWTPASLPGLVAWYDSSDAATITASGGLVSQWSDKSGNGRHLTQESSGRRPTTGAATQNGLNVLSFAQKNLSRASVSVAQPITAAYVGKFGASDTWIPAVSFSPSPASYSVYPGDTRWLIYNGASVFSSGAKDANPHLFASVHNGASSSLRIDRAQVGAGNPGAAGMTWINLGAADNNGGITGWLGEIVIVGGVLSGGDLASLETYLKTKWGTP